MNRKILTLMLATATPLTTPAWAEIELEIFRGSEGFQFSFDTKPEKKYQLVSTVNFVWWRVVGSPIEGTGSVEKIDIPTSPVSRQFYGLQEILVFPETGLEMIPIPAGTFLMGNPDPSRSTSDEAPQTEVVLTKSFWISKYELTHRQVQKVIGTSYLPWEPDFFQFERRINSFKPADMLSWDEANRFCQSLTDFERKSGRLSSDMEFRLPSEAQWEYVARAGSTSAGFSFLNAHAWYEENSNIRGPWSSQAPGLKEPNSWGLHDVLGNVSEWCLDWYRPNLPGGSVTDPLVTEPHENKIYRLHVYRGGHYGSDRFAVNFTVRKASPEIITDSGGPVGIRPILISVKD